MAQYKCEKHGLLGPYECAKWSKSQFGRRWCIHCMNDFMDKFCGKLIVIENEPKEKSNNDV